ncbi:dynein regulatory complex subunit 2 [Halyomorpha halys]|uniref:dynein regulatory complex subunit 2 n=1 Tax=Halyomorpha halys TaxID=286706 RepID=UPI0006D50FAA|nr:coiled-coil domain-containing protein 65 [Halyomorpha halys]
MRTTEADDEEEMDPEKRKQLEKQRLKEEKKLQAQKDEEERKFNLRKDILTKELDYYHSVEDQIRDTVNFTAEVLKENIISADKEQFWGDFRMKTEWKDFHRGHLLENVKGRSAGEDLVNHIYLESFDQILGSYQEIMLQMLNDFEFQRDRMLKKHWSFLKYAKLKGMETRDDIRTVSYGISDRYERKCQVLARKQRKYRMKCHKKHLDETAETDFDLETKAFNLWVQFRTVFGRFRKDWKLAKRLVIFLKLKDREDRKEIEKQRKLLNEVQDLKNINNNSGKNFWSEKNKELVAERKEYTNTYGQLLYKFKENMKFDESQITHLSKVSLETIKKLEKLKERVERVLKIKKMCYKYETEEEKVFPSEYIELFKPIIREEFDSAFCMDKLTYRTGLVQSHCDHMQAKFEEEKRINEDLKEKLKFVLSQLRPDRDIDRTMEYYK